MDYWRGAFTNLPKSTIFKVFGFVAGIVPLLLVPYVLYKLRELRNPDNITLNILNIYMFRIMIIALVI